MIAITRKYAIVLLLNPGRSALLMSEWTVSIRKWWSMYLWRWYLGNTPRRCWRSLLGSLAGMEVIQGRLVWRFSYWQGWSSICWSWGYDWRFGRHLMFRFVLHVIGGCVALGWDHWLWAFGGRVYRIVLSLWNWSVWFYLLMRIYFLQLGLHNAWTPLGWPSNVLWATIFRIALIRRSLLWQRGIGTSAHFNNGL